MVIADPYADAVDEDGIRNDLCIPNITNPIAGTAIGAWQGGFEDDCTGSSGDVLGAGPDAYFLKCSNHGFPSPACDQHTDEGWWVLGFGGFASLGNGGYLTLNFTDNICLVDDDTSTPDVAVGEYGRGEYVYVSVGQIGNTLSTPPINTGGATHIDLSVLNISWFNQIMIEDDIRDPDTGRNYGADLDYVMCLHSRVPVAVDIKPISCPNPLNLKSTGVLSVAILGTEEFDVTKIDPESVQLVGVAPLRWYINDVATPYIPLIGKASCNDCNEIRRDGFDDLTLRFRKRDIVEALGEVEDGECLILELTGNLFEVYGGTSFVGEDVIWIRS